MIYFRALFTPAFLFPPPPTICCFAVTWRSTLFLCALTTKLHLDLILFPHFCVDFPPITMCPFRILFLFAAAAVVQTMSCGATAIEVEAPALNPPPALMVPPAVGDVSNVLANFDPESVERLRQQVNAAYVDADLSALAIPASMGLIDRAQLFGTGGGLSAPATGSLSTTFFNRVLKQVAAIINDVGKKTVIPGGSGSNFGYNEIRFSQFSVDSITFRTEAPNRLALAINGLTIVIPNTGFNVHSKVLFVKVKCNGNFNAQVIGASIAVTMTMGHDGKGHLTAAATASASFQRVAIHHSFNGFLCKVAGSIVNLLIGNIDKKISEAVRNQVPKAIGPAATKAMEVSLRKLPMYFTGAPSVSGDGFSVTVDLLATPQVSLQQDSTDLILAGFDGSLLEDYSRDITLSVPQTSVNNIMQTAFNGKKFYYKIVANKAGQDTTAVFKPAMKNAYDACPDCKLVMIFDVATKAPSVTFVDSAITANVEAVTVSFLGKKADGTEVPLFVVQADMLAGVNGLTIRTVTNNINNMFFQVAMDTFQFTTKSTSVGPLPILDIMYPIVTFCVKDLAIPAFNANFAGLDFPAVMTNAKVKSATGVFEFATDVVLS